LQSCYEEILRIGILVKDLENLAKVESQILKLNKSFVDLHSLVVSVCTGFEIEASKKRIALAVAGKVCMTFVDEDRIKQVVFNLLSNAIKYTPDDGKITVTVQEKLNSFNVYVEDDGIGIPKEEIPLIFERFYRADKSRNRKTGGAGIGLAIVKSIVQAHGGTITVKSQIDKGSQFVICLPKV
jgi:signal transduction histidine kinase